MTFRTNIAGLTSSLTHARVRQSYETLLRASYHIGLTRLALGIRTKQQRCTVLLYHGVDIRTEGAQEIGGEWYVDLAEFRRQMEFLQRHFRLLSLGEAVSHIENGTPFPRGSAVVSFDDGYRNNLVQAYPVLNEFGIPFSVFVATGYLGNHKSPWWEQLKGALARSAQPLTLRVDSSERLYDLTHENERRRAFTDAQRLIMKSPDREEDVIEELRKQLSFWPEGEDTDLFLSSEELQTLSRSPLVQIGSHSLSHASLANLEQDEMRREVVDSKGVLEEYIGKSVEYFAYPYGGPQHYSPEVVRAVREAGYRCALTTLSGRVGYTDDPFQIKRISIDGRDDWPLFEGKLAGVAGFLDSLGRTVYHG